MPTYTYECGHCHKVKEVTTSMGNRPTGWWCLDCEATMYLVPSIPARVTPGTYGKGGGKK